MDNIPAMKGEEYMTTLRNYLARIEFEIEEYLSPTTGGKNASAQPGRMLNVNY